MNTRAKGRAKELKTKRRLEELGYQVILAPNPSRWQTETDFFHMWDICAVNETEVLWIQVKSRKTDAYGKNLERHRAWKGFGRKQVWIWEKRARNPIIWEL